MRIKKIIECLDGECSIAVNCNECGNGHQVEIDRLTAENAKLQRAVDRVADNAVRIGCPEVDGCIDDVVITCEACWRKWLMRDEA